MQQAASHRYGQYRAELFEELIRRILSAKYPGAKITQDFLTMPGVQSSQVDFFVQTSPRAIFVESRAPYSANPWAGVRRSIRLLQDLNRRAGSDAILALADRIPSEGTKEVETVKARFSASGTTFEIWDEPAILRLTEEHLNRHLNSLSPTDVLVALGKVEETPPSRSRAFEFFIAGPGPTPALPEGRLKGVVVLMADFCSYSAFVKASQEEGIDLVSSIMGRLYRESRRVVLEHGGVLDKFMGDGLLAFWLPEAKSANDPGASVMNCATRLTGMAIRLAEEWQERIDDQVVPKGMRCGAAIGEVLFISEDPLNPGLVHAIGDAINLAARLQSSADPNSIAISNRLHTSHFRAAPELVEFNPDAKNMGTKKAWKKQLA